MTQPHWIPNFATETRECYRLEEESPTFAVSMQ